MLPAAIALSLAAPATVIDLAGRTIRLGDVLRVPDERTAALPIAHLPEDRRSVTLSGAALASLIRRAAPAVAPDARLPRQVTFRREAAGERHGCFVARTSIDAGERLTPDLVQRGACSQDRPPVRYRDGAVVVTRLVEPGMPVGSALSSPAPAIERGKRLTLVTRSGAVTVERAVVALQTGREGGRVFVRGTDGAVLAAPVGKGGR